MSQAADQVVVHTRQVVHTLGRFFNQLQGIVVENRALFHLHRHHHHVGATEVFFQLVVGFDIGVVLR